MLTRKQIKHIKSLHQKKYRDIYRQFIVEGQKLVGEFLNSDIPILQVYSSSDNFRLPPSCSQKIKPEHITPQEMQRISTLKTPPSVIAVVQQREEPVDIIKNISGKNITLMLDNIQNPGNFGTIIRTCDWFGIQNVICSPDTVDLYNPKVVQATMGAIIRVDVVYANLQIMLEQLSKQKEISVIGTFMTGNNLYKTELPERAVVIFGNEGTGISAELIPYLSTRITIPAYPENTQQAESLNVAVAASVICSEFRRREFTKGNL